MKKILFVLLLFTTLFSCKKDDNGDEGETSGENIYGTYVLSKVESNKAIDPEGDGSFISGDVTSAVGCSSTVVFVEATDGDDTGVFQRINLTQTEASNNPIVLNPMDCNTFTANGSIIITEGSVTLDGGTVGTYIFLVEGNKLVLTITNSFVYTEVNGTITQTTVDLTLTYTKN